METRKKDMMGKLHNSKKKETYTDSLGNVYQEAAGTYNYAMTNAVARDMMRIPFLNPGLSEERKETLRECSESMRALNLALARRLDDAKAGRELTEYDYDMAKDAILKITVGASREDSLATAALRRILVMDNWAFAAEQQAAIREARFRASVREYDADGNLIDGLSVEEELQVQALCKTRCDMLALLLRTDVLSDMHQKILDALEAMDITTQAALNGTLDELIAAASQKE